MRTETVYAIRWGNLWWNGREHEVGKVEQTGSIFLKDARFFSDPEVAQDIAKELRGYVKRVDLVSE